MQLKQGTLLQGGKYKIERHLDQGGFGITYLAKQPLLNRSVAIKEFFMKGYCERDAGALHVTVPTQRNRELVTRFRTIFVKEAQTIAALNHPHIMRIYDIFEENGTAYYVMEYHDNGSLADLVRHRGALPETEAVRYIRETADALDYLHKKQINHLDVKPANILIGENGGAVLIDFGISKHYNEEGEATIPVGISHGYAPVEQYVVNGICSFSPATDIYSLGATLYKLLTGTTPPEASDVLYDGLPPFPQHISPAVCNAIEQAMQPKRKDRPQSISAFLALFAEQSVIPVDNETDILVTDVEVVQEPQSRPTSLANSTPAPTPAPEDEEHQSSKGWLWMVLLPLIVVAIAALFYSQSQEQDETINLSVSGTIDRHEYVDLGLSVKWATCNVGATSPAGYGDYFAWGETTPKTSYTEANCKTWEKNIGDIKGNPNYDAACYNWRGSWRLPTKAEMQELIDNCTWSWTTQNSVNGYKVTSKINGNSIFLPAAGWRYGTSLYRAGESGRYWASTPGESDTWVAYDLDFSSDDHYVGWGSRDYGRSVRPVSE